MSGTSGSDLVPYRHYHKLECFVGDGNVEIIIGPQVSECLTLIGCEVWSYFSCLYSNVNWQVTSEDC